MLDQGGAARRCTHLVLGDPLTYVVMASKGDIAGDGRLILIKSTAETLLFPLLRCALEKLLLLLLLLLGEIELVDASVAVLGRQRGNRVCACIWI